MSMVGRMMAPVALAADLPFPDLDKSWYRYSESVAFLRERGAVGGHPDGTFRPKDPVNRAELLKMLFLARGSNAPVAGECFPDVATDAWFAPYVCAAVRRNIVRGYPDGTFRPEQTVNMAEAMKMLLLAYGRTVEEGTGERWYRPFTEAFAQEGVLPRHAYLPWSELNRERAADLLARFLREEEERIVLNESPGCGRRAPDDLPSAVDVDGEERAFLLTVPESYAPRTPVPLIVAFHGRTNPNEQARSYYGLDRAADGYLIAYPAGVPAASGGFTWSNGSDPRGWVRDVALFDALVEELGAQYCIDLDRVYTVGHSLGAWIANSVACIRGDIVRASATVGGDTAFTPCAGPAAALIIHNPDDALAPFSGAEALRDLRVTTNACSTDAPPEESAPRRLNCQAYRGCDGGNAVVFCPHELDEDGHGNHYPHNWPRGTGEEIVDFFESL